MLSSLEANTFKNPEGNMVSGGHIGFRKCTNNIRNEFPIPKLCKIDPLHTFPCSLVQKLMIAQNPIWRPAAILDLWHFPGSDWWGFLGCGYWGTKGMKSAEKPFVRIFSTLNFILTGLVAIESSELGVHLNNSPWREIILIQNHRNTNQ